MNYFSRKDGYIYLDAEYAEFYIPLEYFDRLSGFSEDLGQVVRTLGVFNVAFFENGKVKEHRILNLPTQIELFVSDYEDKAVQLPHDDKAVPCKVLKFIKGSRLMLDSIVENSSNVQVYLDFITKGKLPPSIPYSDSLRLWTKNQEMNGVNLGVSSTILEMILAALYRYKDDPTMKFAKVIGKDPSTSEYDYMMLNIRQVCQYASTFTALTFEDFDSMVTSSLNRTRQKKPEAYTPIEQVIKM